LTLALAVTFATITLMVLPVPQTSNYAQIPPVLSKAEIDPSDKALLAVGLLSKKSVMDAPSTDLKPTKAPPSVPEHREEPKPQMPQVKDTQPPSDIKPTEPKSTDMSGVPPSQPTPPPSMPAPAGPQPGPQPSNTDSTTMSSVPPTLSSSSAASSVSTTMTSAPKSK